MIKTWDNQTITANQAAKMVVAERGINNWDCWRDHSIFQEHLLTDREFDAINVACNHQSARVLKFLGLSV